MQIEILHIYSDNLEEQFMFYKHRMNLPVEKISSDKIEVQVGYSVLEIEKSTAFNPYHLAFHIAAEQENRALEWLKERVDILEMEEEEIIDFSSWNAKSIYFYDADHNVLEFISRKHIHQTSSKDFSEKQIYGIAEIGLAVENVESTFEQLHRETGLEQYAGNLEEFCPIGDDSGLLITVDKNKKTWFPTTDKSENAAFKLRFTHQEEYCELEYDGLDLFIEKFSNP